MPCSSLSHHAVAVELDLVQPVLAPRRLGDERRQLRLEARRKRASPRTLDALRVGRAGLIRVGRPGAASRLLAVTGPHPVGACGDLLHGTAGQGAVGRPRRDRRLLAAARLVVALLEEQPVVLVLLVRPALDTDEHPAAAQLLALQAELELALAIGPLRIGGALPVGIPAAPVPDHDRAAAVLALGDDALEVGVVQRVVLDVDGEMLVVRIEARALRHGPALERAVELEPDVVVQPPGRVLLDDEEVAARAGLDVRSGLGCLAEVPFLAVALQCHAQSMPVTPRAAAPAWTGPGCPCRASAGRSACSGAGAGARRCRRGSGRRPGTSGTCRARAGW